MTDFRKKKEREETEGIRRFRSEFWKRERRETEHNMAQVSFWDKR
jgi:hypothetical protein